MNGCHCGEAKLAGPLAGGQTWVALGCCSWKKVGSALLRGATVARGQGFGWLLIIDHHGVFHVGRHRREYRLEIRLRWTGDLLGGGQRGL
jgi:hypothetical protein